MFDRIQAITGKKVRWEYRDEPRKGDHICYISDLRKLRAHFPNWKLTYTLERILDEILQAERMRSASAGKRLGFCEALHFERVNISNSGTRLLFCGRR